MTAVDGSLDALARRCFERGAQEAEEQLDRKIAGAGEFGKKASSTFFQGCGCLLALSCLGGIIGGLAAGSWALLIVPGLSATVWLLVAYARSQPTHQRRAEIRATVQRGIAAYENGEHWAVLRVHEFAVAEFRENIQTHRERTLGRDSEWGRARTELAQAADEAQRSAAYWRERFRGEPESGLARTQRGIADRLEGEAPVDNIEYLADRIIESSDRERSTIEDLDRRLSHVAH